MNELHHQPFDAIPYSHWEDLAALAGVTLHGEALTALDAWNRIATALNMPNKAGRDIITDSEWNEAVDRAIARSA